jgi:hypothetical protein
MFLAIDFLRKIVQIIDKTKIKEIRIIIKLFCAVYLLPRKVPAVKEIASKR